MSNIFLKVCNYNYIKRKGQYLNDKITKLIFVTGCIGSARPILSLQLIRRLKTVVLTYRCLLL